MKKTMNPRYKELLGKFYDNDELRELLDLLRIDIARRNMVAYHANGKMPEQIDSLDTLIYDLITMEEYWALKNK